MPNYVGVRCWARSTTGTGERRWSEGNGEGPGYGHALGALPSGHCLWTSLLCWGVCLRSASHLRPAEDVRLFLGLRWDAVQTRGAPIGSQGGSGVRLTGLGLRADVRQIVLQLICNRAFRHASRYIGWGVTQGFFINSPVCRDAPRAGQPLSWCPLFLLPSLRLPPTWPFSNVCWWWVFCVNTYWLTGAGATTKTLVAR